MGSTRIRIFWPLLGAFLLVSGVALFLGETLVATRIRSELVGLYRTELRRELSLGREILAQSRGADPDSLALFMTRRLEYRVTIVGVDGEVLGDSDISDDRLDLVENHRGRPEVLAVLMDTTEVGFASRRSETLGVRLLYGAVRARFEDRQVVLRIAVPVTAIDDSVARLRRWFLALGLFGLVASTLLAALLGLRLTRPLGLVSDGARRLADGDLSTRIQAGSGLTEIDRVAVSFNRLASELQARIDELKQERDDMQVLIDSIDEGIITLTEDGRILGINKAALDMLALPDAVPLAPISALLRKPEVRDLVEQAVIAPVKPTEVRVGDRSLIMASRRQESGGALITLLDITELRRLEAVRSDFVANASHELKTPLTSMRGFAETLLEADPPAELREGFLTSIRDNSIRLQRLVDDLLDLSRLESGGWIAREEEVEVAELAQEVWDGVLRDTARDHEIRFKIVGSALVLADERGLSQVFRNLFDNAVRHSGSRGRVTVTIGAEAPLAEVSVQDGGSGIPTAALPRIFERFFRADPARSRAEGGTGLGLAIVRHMINAMGGKISAESELGRGTTIRFTLPLIETGPEDSRPKES